MYKADRHSAIENREPDAVCQDSHHESIFDALLSPNGDHDLYFVLGMEARHMSIIPKEQG